MPRPAIPKFAIVILVIAAAALLFYWPSYSRYRELKTESERLDKELAALRTQITALQKEKQLLHNDKDYVESVIRKELGLVEPGEVVYEFDKKNRRTPAGSESAAKKAPDSPENDPSAGT